MKRHFMPARHLLDVTLRRAFFIVVAALTLCVCAAVPSSSSVLAVSLEQLSTSSQLIFEGEVVGKTSDFNANQTSIHTYVTFRVVDVVKGTYTQPEITLRFLGGTVGEIGLNGFRLNAARTWGDGHLLRRIPGTFSGQSTLRHGSGPLLDPRINGSTHHDDSE